MRLRARNNPSYYEKTQCSECREFGLVLEKHRTTDVLTCADCINDMLREASEASEESTEKYPSFCAVTGERIE